MDHLPPPDDAYGRVTAPERYAVVHDAADRLIADLVGRYDVATSPGDPTDLGRSGGIELLRVVRLVPTREDAAPLTVGFTAFPGVLVRFGHWHIQAFPSCGCDACDEHPDDVIRELDDHVTALVQGRFTDALVGRWRPWQTAEFTGSDGGWRRRSSQRIDRATRRQLLERGRGRHDWQPWPLR
jgi:hypothetical protein